MKKVVASMSVDEYRKLGKQRTKFNVGTASTRTWKGVWHWERMLVFDSARELKRFAELILLEDTSKILGLQVQPRFEISPTYIMTNGTLQRGQVYVGDFFYYRMTDEVFDGDQLNRVPVCEDVKGFKTQVYKSKIRKARAMYPEIEFVEV